jgi:uncharacterized protein YndB with AHSA1/START domain
MPDIIHYFTVNDCIEKVFSLVSTSEGLNKWWTRSCGGVARKGEVYRLDFGPQYEWEAVVEEVRPPYLFELRVMRSDNDWMGSKIRFELSQGEGQTHVRFFHTNWPVDNEHRRISNYCWAMYLRLLKLNLETGLFVPYEKRLEV